MCGWSQVSILIAIAFGPTLSIWRLSLLKLSWIKLGAVLTTRGRRKGEDHRCARADVLSEKQSEQGTNAGKTEKISTHS